MADKTYPTLELVIQLYKDYQFFYVTATTNGEHTSGSYHYRGEALDIGSGLRRNTGALLKAAHTDRFTELDKLAAYLYARSSLITELFSTKSGTHTGHYVKDGVRKSYDWAHSNGLTTEGESVDHIHVAVASSSDAGKLLVLAVQAALGLSQDAVYGPKSKAAVEAVQKAAKIHVDGIVGPQTVTAIRAHNKWAKVV